MKKVNIVIFVIENVLVKMKSIKLEMRLKIMKKKKIKKKLKKIEKKLNFLKTF